MNHTELRAALAEDERIQQAATAGPWEGRWLPYGGVPPAPCNFGVISIPKNGIETARIWEQADAEFILEARTRWPERTKQLREALDEIELLKGAMAADEERLRTHGMRVGIWFGCDTAEHMADEIERLNRAIESWKREEQIWREAESAMNAEIERMKAAGKVLAHEGVPFGDRDKWWEARKVFEEGE